MLLGAIVSQMPPADWTGAEVIFSAAKCSADKPLLLTLTNRLPVSLGSANVRIKGRAEGYSDDLYSFFYRSDKIIRGWGSSSECLEVNGWVVAPYRDPNRLIPRDSEMVWDAHVEHAYTFSD